jgi:hypothetical protein
VPRASPVVSSRKHGLATGQPAQPTQHASVTSACSSIAAHTADRGEAAAAARTRWAMEESDAPHTYTAVEVDPTNRYTRVRADVQSRGRRVGGRMLAQRTSPIFLLRRKALRGAARSRTARAPAV